MFEQVNFKPWTTFWMATCVLSTFFLRLKALRIKWLVHEELKGKTKERKTVDQKRKSRNHSNIENRICHLGCQETLVYFLSEYALSDVDQFSFRFLKQLSQALITKLMLQYWISSYCLYFPIVNSNWIIGYVERHFWPPTFFGR